MSRIYDAVDFFWSYDGDLDLGDDGDLRDTSFDVLRSLRQEITSRVKSEHGDWRWQKSIGADLSRFVGMPNNRRTGTEIKNAVISAIIYNNLVDPRDVNVKVAPISPNVVAVRVIVNRTPTRANLASLPVTIDFLYDYADNNVFPTTGNFSV